MMRWRATFSSGFWTLASRRVACQVDRPDLGREDRRRRGSAGARCSAVRFRAEDGPPPAGLRSATRGPDSAAGRLDLLCPPFRCGQPEDRHRDPSGQSAGSLIDRHLSLPAPSGCAFRASILLPINSQGFDPVRSLDGRQAATCATAADRIQSFHRQGLCPDLTRLSTVTLRVKIGCCKILPEFSDLTCRSRERPARRRSVCDRPT